MYSDIIVSASYILLGFIIFFVSKFIKDFITPFDDNKALTESDNTALGLSVAGYYIAVTTIFLGAAIGPSLNIEAFESNTAFYKAALLQVGITGAWAFGGIMALNLARFVLDKVILNKFNMAKEIIQDKNVGAGAAEFGSYIATGLVIAAAIYGEGGSYLTALAFFGAGQLALIIFTKIYQAITPFNIYEEIEKDNVAVGVALAGNFIAMGLVVASASTTPFISWSESLIAFGITFAFGVVFLSVGRLVADKVLTPKASLSKEISVDRNCGAALVECAAVISFGAIAFTMI